MSQDDQEDCEATDSEFDVLNAVDGWSLEDFTWRERTGLAEFIYSRGTGRHYEERRVVRCQPTVPSHVGWRNSN